MHYLNFDNGSSRTISEAYKNDANGTQKDGTSFFHYIQILKVVFFLLMIQFESNLNDDIKMVHESDLPKFTN